MMACYLGADLVVPSTGEKRFTCPDTSRVHDEPGSAAREVQCSYQTNDRSLLTKHRIKRHGYIPRLRSLPTERPVSFTFVSSRQSVAAPIKKITTSVRRQKEVVTRNDAVKLARDRAICKAKEAAARGHSDPSYVSQDNLVSPFVVDSPSSSIPIAEPSSVANNNIQSPLVLANPRDSSRDNHYVQGIPQDQYGSIVPMDPQQSITSSHMDAYSTVALIGVQQDIQDETEGFLNSGTAYAGHNNTTLDQWASYNDTVTLPNQEHIYGYLDFAQWQEVIDSYRNAIPAARNSTTHTLAEHTLDQEAQAPSAPGIQNTLVAPDQAMTGFAFLPAPNDDWPTAGSASTQPLVGGEASTESSTPVEDYLNPYPDWLPADVWDDIWAPLKQQSMSNMDSVMSSMRADEVEDYLSPVPDPILTEIWDGMLVSS